MLLFLTCSPASSPPWAPNRRARLRSCSAACSRTSRRHARRRPRRFLGPVARRSGPSEGIGLPPSSTRYSSEHCKLASLFHSSRPRRFLGFSQIRQSFAERSEIVRIFNEARANQASQTNFEWNNVSLVVDIAVCSHFAGSIALRSLTWWRTFQANPTA